MTRANWHDAIFGCPVCRRRLDHLSYCRRRHNPRACACPFCAGWRKGYWAAAVDDVKLRELAAAFEPEVVDRLARIRRDAA